MSTIRNGQTPTVDVIKAAATGRWAEILTSLGGVAAELLDGKHHPCPKCGGTDRFRMIDTAAGALYCNACFSSGNGDGISALQWLTGRPFKEMCAMLADHLGLLNGNGRARGKAKKAADEATLSKGIEPIKTQQVHETLLSQYCKAKPPITPEAVKQCGGSLVRWYDYRCIRLDGRAPIDSPTPTAVVLLRVEGEPFPAFGKLSERKTHTTKGSVNSWLASGDVATAETVIDVEGITDLAGRGVGWPSARLGRSHQHGRREGPREPATGMGQGQEDHRHGRHRQSRPRGVKASPPRHISKPVRRKRSSAQLPYPAEKDHGKDLRDWLNEGHKIEELPTVGVTAEQAAEWSKAKHSTASDQAAGGAGGCPMICVDPQTMPVGETLHQVTDRLLATGHCFSRTDQLVVVHDDTIIADPVLTGIRWTAQSAR